MEQLGSLKLVTNTINNSFHSELKKSFLECNRFLISVAFISSSALGVLAYELNALREKGIKGKVITTNYMNGTDPKALEFLYKYENIETKIYDTTVKNHGFHTKAYIFEMEDHIKIYVGSSNLTIRALKTNREWNVRFLSKDDPFIKQIYDAFDELWDDTIPLNNEFINTYSMNYYKERSFKERKILENILSFIKQNKNIDILKKIADYMEIEEDVLKDQLAIEYQKEVKPNSMQEQACERLRLLREQGENKALVIAATGTGKTYLAAFDVSQMNPKRVLFVCHREKILNDAMKTFKTIMPDIKMGILSGNQKDYDSNYLFATNQMISKDYVLELFEKNHFDYIIIDEAHRSAAGSYQKVLDYFEPRFSLGMTATPERTDNLNIYEYFDYNIAVETRLRQALEENLIVPFIYYGIDDISTDLSKFKFKSVDKLAEKLNIKSRVDLIIEHMNKYPYAGKKRKTLGFCVNQKHAVYMSNEFNQRGISSIYLLGDNNQYEREEAINKLSDEFDPLTCIFTVDIFNEGIDIPSVNTILMLRPTESPIIFIQQLGRGLRHYQFKEYLTVLDFIGNHTKTFMIPIALAGDSAYDKDDLIVATKDDFFDIPGDTFILLEEKPKERILKRLDEVNFNYKKFLDELYFNHLNKLKESNKDLIYPKLIQYGFDGFDPVRFIKSEKTYYNYVLRMTRKTSDTINLLNEEEMKILKFIDDMLPIKQPVLFVIISMILKNKTIILEDVKHELYKYNYQNFNQLDYYFEYLDFKYFDDNTKKRYLKIVNYANNELTIKPSIYDKIYNNETLKNFIHESLSYGLARYMHEFNETKLSNGFKYYYNYSMLDVPIIIKYIHKISAFRGQGVISSGNDYYLFVDLLKKDVKKSVDYQDKFIDQKTIQWESQNSSSQSSKSGKRFINHKELGINLFLFVRKNKKEDGQVQGYTYFGPANVVKYTGNKPIRFILELTNKIPDNIYKRFIIEEKEDDDIETNN